MTYAVLPVGFCTLNVNENNHRVWLPQSLLGSPNFMALRVSRVPHIQAVIRVRSRDTTMQCTTTGYSKSSA